MKHLTWINTALLALLFNGRSEKNTWITSSGLDLLLRFQWWMIRERDSPWLRQAGGQADNRAGEQWPLFGWPFVAPNPQSHGAIFINHVLFRKWQVNDALSHTHTYTHYSTYSIRFSLKAHTDWQTKGHPPPFHFSLSMSIAMSLSGGRVPKG